MPVGPFPARAEEPWASKNAVVGICGRDALYDNGERTEGPLKLAPEITNGDLSSVPAEVDLLIVGAGLSGSVIAERCASEFGMTSLLIDKRPHIGGNCFDFVNEHGIRQSKYGAHLFHTNHERVWDYMCQFSEWQPFDHRVRGRVPDMDGVNQLVPIPPVQTTVNVLFKESISSEKEMQEWYDKHRKPPPNGEPNNSEEAALARVGPQLYDKIFKHYTKKQWDKYPAELDASVMLRLPCRTSTDERYFGDKWQALPLRGYTRIFENMLCRNDKITVRVGVDFFAARQAGNLPKYGMLVFTGQIDSYFAQQGMPKLEYRSLHFQEEFVQDPPDGFFQEAMVVNYPMPDVPYTRIVEYKHVPNQTQAVKSGEVKGTVIVKETSSAEGDPYYPVPNPDNRALYERYRLLAEAEKEVCFAGRLASYKYFNMDEAVLNALEIYDSLKERGRLQPKRKIDKISN